jgi:hypothetical protein
LKPVKKIVFAIVAALLVLAQLYFILFMRLVGRQAFSSMYDSFGAEPTAYTKFMFAYIDLWWIFPFFCGGLVYWTFRRWSGMRACMTLLAILVCCGALLLSAYSSIFKMGSVI